MDVANDVAFLAMDLDYEGRSDLARHFVARMAAALGDRGMTPLMDFYKCYRAYVRGKVESLHSVVPAAPEAERAVSAERAGRYFRLALQYSIAGSQPLVLAVIGRIGTGKSTVAEALAQELGWEVFSSDRVRKRLAGFPPGERSEGAARTRLYSQAMTQLTYHALFRHAARCVKAHRSVILDATFGRRVYRDQLKDALARSGASCRFIEAQANDAFVKQRLEGRDSGAKVVSDARLEDFDDLNRRFEAPAELALRELLSLSTEDSSAAELLAALKGLTLLHLKTPG